MMLKTKFKIQHNDYKRTPRRRTQARMRRAQRRAKSAGRY